MAARPARTRQARDGAGGKVRRRGALPWGLGLLSGVLVVVATPTAALVGGLLAPTLLTVMFDTADGKPIARCVAMCGLAAAVFPLAALWTQGHAMELSLSLLSDPLNLVTAWTAQGAGWLLAQLAPLLTSALQSASAAARVARLQAARARLAEEWGIAPVIPAGDISAAPERPKTN